MKFTRQQRLGLVLTGILMALLALLIALTRPAPAAGYDQPEQADPAVQPAPDDPVAVKKKKRLRSPAPPPPSRNPLDEEF